MNPGSLRHRLTIKVQSTTAQSELGMPVENYTTKATVWGKIEPLSGRELWLAKQVNANVTHRVIIRGNQSVGPTDQIVFDGRTFNVLSVADMQERGISKSIMCMESV